MLKVVVAFVLTTSFATGQALAFSVDSGFVSRAATSVAIILPAQYGQGPGRGDGRGPVVCRIVPGIPGSGMGPQRVCSRAYQRCRTVVVPGSGRGPQRVCD
jgi:hypothetical protein